MLFIIPKFNSISVSAKSTRMADTGLLQLFWEVARMGQRFPFFIRLVIQPLTLRT